ncbi:MBL fold metallo-hydrolase [Xanthomonas axonopodis pv. vasculorum]|uniref:MBL fold metallo-hydrolase n=1 Tax=Xanthomonas axonopodis TaxID=53413 RepID=UPI001ADA9DEC|nr:MBL fold metallo-hydrolase [Xanthomonas axonopodis]
MDGRTPGVLDRGHLCCHCLLVETSAGLVLIDTGFGLRDVAEPRARLSRFFLALVKPDLREEMTAVRQIQRLGLDDFPHARVHLMTGERDAALAQRTWMDRQRFRPQQWATRGQWRTYDGAAGERWMGLECVRDLHGLPPELLMVPLPGHTLGHVAVAVHTPERWLLLAGDAYFFHRQMDAEAPYCTPGLRAYLCGWPRRRSVLRRECWKCSCALHR